MIARHITLAILSLAVFSFPAAARGGLITYCRADIERLCAGIQPGGGRLIKCLKAHKEEMSVGCAQALMKLKREMGR
jgi:hypothetical protein